MTEETKFQLLQLHNSIIRCCVCVDSSTKYEKKKATFVISAYYYRTIYNSCFVFLFASPWKQNKIVLLTHIQRCSFSVFYFPHSQEKCLCANPNRSRNIISLCPYVRGNTHSFIYIDLLTAKRNLIGSLYEADSHWSLLDNIFLLVANAGRRILLSTRRHCVREYIWFIRLTLKATLFLHGVIANQKRVDGFNMTTNK